MSLRSCRDLGWCPKLIKITLDYINALLDFSKEATAAYQRLADLSQGMFVHCTSLLLQQDSTCW